jgi:hypothetical protein
MNEIEIDAAAHLKTIRSLMERATVYRAISAPGAVVAGVLSLLVCGWLLRQDTSQRIGPIGFVWLWTGILVVVAAFNLWLIYRNARMRGDRFGSAGMKMALRAVAPPLAAGFTLGFLSATRSNNYTDIVSFWILFYGLGLLAMSSFAPRSLLALGGGFLVCGLLAFFPWIRSIDGRDWHAAIHFMSITFGGLHLIYAVSVYLMQRNHTGFDDEPA